MRAWLAVIGLLLAASVLAAALAANRTAATHVFLGAFVYGVVYTVWLKRRSWTNIVVGGLAGSFAVLAGAAAIDPGLAPAPVILAVVLFLWTPPHFWSLATALHKDYAAAGVPMLPVVIGDRAAAWAILGHTVALSLLALLPLAFGLGWIYLAGALIGGGWFTWKSIQLGAKALPGAGDAQLCRLARPARPAAVRGDPRSAAARMILYALPVADPARSCGSAAQAATVLDQDEALRISQAAIGKRLDDLSFRDTDRETGRASSTSGASR